MNKDKMPHVFITDISKPTIETINKGKPCYFKGEIHYIVYETLDFKLISKNKDLSKVFSVNPKDFSYVKKSN